MLRRKAGHFLALIRFSHTVFAMPYAMLAFVLALARPLPSGDTVEFRWVDLLAIVLCMVFARSAAMAFNRLADRRYDADNPRTGGRHIPAGVLGAGEVTVFTIACCVGFIASCAIFLPNWIPLALSGPVLGFLLGYSFAKRFTAGAHLWLGVALSLSPVCVWLAIRGPAALFQPLDLLPPVVLAVAVATWVAGFDIIYACQDAEYDRQAGLHSVPARYGVRRALRRSAMLHAASVAALAALPLSGGELGLGVVYWMACVIIAGLLFYEHSLVRPDDLSRVGVAFFNVNAFIGVLVLIAGSMDVWFG